MAAALGVALLWIAFAATHMGLASLRLRPRLVAALGERAYLGLYSLVAFATFVPVVWLYMTHRHEGALLWSLSIGPVGLWTIYVLQGIAWVLTVAGLVQPSPVTVGLPEELRPTQPRGVQRITRHPLFMGVGLFGALHLPVTGFGSDVAFWLGFPLFAVVGCAHQDRRKRATQPGYDAWCRATPFLPFAKAGALRGLAELPPLAVVLGVALATGLRWLHGPLFR
jgi:uncharacterized membrane protein